jgi:hypothetical protein
LLSQDAIIDELDNGTFSESKDIASTPLDIAAASLAMDQVVIEVLLHKQILLGVPVTKDLIFSAIAASENDHINCPAYRFLLQNQSLPWFGIPGNQIRKDDGETALHECVRKDAVSVLKEMLAHPDLNVNERNERGFTALHYACLFASNECVELLLAHGADIELKSNLPSPGYTALGIVMIARRIDLVIRVRFSLFPKFTTNKPKVIQCRRRPVAWK